MFSEASIRLIDRENNFFVNVLPNPLPPTEKLTELIRP